MLVFRPTWSLRSPFMGINRFEASAEENVPYGKINVRPRSSSDVKSNPKQTQRSNMGSIPGKHSPQRGGVNCKRRDKESSLRRWRDSVERKKEKGRKRKVRKKEKIYHQEATHWQEERKDLPTER